MRGTTFRKRSKFSSCTPLALANNRQQNNSTVVVPTDHNMDSLLSVELIRDFKRTAVFRTGHKQFDLYQLMIMTARSQSVHINRRESCACNCTSKFMCSYPELCDVKNSNRTRCTLYKNCREMAQFAECSVVNG
jgi:hypothetical protein